MSKIRVLTLLALLGACDPVVGSTLRLLPAPTATGGDTADAARRSQSRSALLAVERLALRFGLAPYEDPSRCARAWALPYHVRTDAGKRHGALHLCAILPADGALQVHLGEGPASAWSAKGDSLRRELTDTLARYGRVIHR